MKFMPRTAGRSVRLAAVLAVTAPLGLLLATVAGPAQASALKATPLGAKIAFGSSSADSRLKKIEAAASKESKATFKLTYTSKGSGSTSQMTIEQKPPQQLWKTSDGEMIFNGKKAYYCSTSGGVTCVVYGSMSASPFAGMMGLYGASTYVQEMQGWQGLISEHIFGFHISFSRARFAGQASECVTWSYQGANTKYCVTNSGVLAYVGSWGKSSGGNSSFALTSFSSHVRGSDFSLPRGAKITTMP
jgi:hypothetical protein